MISLAHYTSCNSLHKFWLSCVVFVHAENIENGVALSRALISIPAACLKFPMENYGKVAVCLFNSRK